MKYIIFALITSFSFSNEYFSKICHNAITTQGNYIYTDKINFHPTQNGTYIFGLTRKFGGFIDFFNENKNEVSFTMNFDKRIYDLQEDEEYIYALTKDRVLKINKISKKVQEMRTLESPPLKRKEFALEIELIHHKIYVAHGSHHLVVLDKDSGEILTKKNFSLPHHSNGHQSALTGLVKFEDRLLLSFDNITYDFANKRRAFEGLVVADIETLKQEKAIQINWKREALADPSLDIYEGKLYSQNLEILFQYDLNRAIQSKVFKPNKRYHSLNKSTILGRAFVQDGKIKGCFQKYHVEKGVFSSFYNEINL